MDGEAVGEDSWGGSNIKSPFKASHSTRLLEQSGHAFFFFFFNFVTLSVET